LESERKKQAAEEKKAAAADKDAAAKERSASQSRVQSSIDGYLRSASRKRDEASKARSKAADHSSKVADYQAKVHAAEEKLSKARAAEEKKRTDDAKREQARQATRAKQDQSRREAEERRQRQEAERLARRAATERQRADASRAQQDEMIDRRLTHVDRTVADVAAIVEQRPWENVPEKITVLFISALPDCEDPLNIDREVREIQEQVRASKHRDAITFEYRPASRVLDLVQHLNEVEPDVVHFSGHGEDAGIVLHDRDDQAQLLTGEQLAGLLAVAPKPIKLVVLNSCDSAELARAVVQHATAAIGMEQSIEDETARVFAGQLYNSLGFGKSVGLAFDQAKFQVMLTFDELSGDPTLVMADGVDASDFVVVSPAGA
jgi:hypothetical protein